MADLLGELTTGNSQQILIDAIGLALRDRPVALVPAREERAARVTEQDLRLAGGHGTAKEEDPGALPDSHRRIVGGPARRSFAQGPAITSPGADAAAARPG